MSDTVKVLQRLKRKMAAEARRWEKAMVKHREGSATFEAFRASAVWMRSAESWVVAEIRKAKP